ncbi:hypothetical protein GCM10027082_47270 [Comamonas humi]
MNIVTILVALTLAAIGAVLYFLDSIGLGIALIVSAAVLSQTATLSNIWWRYVYRRHGESLNSPPQNAEVDEDILQSAVSEIEESSLDTRSALKNFKAAWHETDANAPPHKDKKGA